MEGEFQGKETQRLEQIQWVQETKVGKSGWNTAARDEDKVRKADRVWSRNSLIGKSKAFKSYLSAMRDVEYFIQRSEVI